MSIDVYFSQEQIEKRIKQLGEEITRDYGEEEVMVVGVLTGSFIFCADLVRAIKSPVDLEFISISTYGSGVVSSGNLRIYLDLKRDIANKNILIIEDIVDTGFTLVNLLSMLRARNPKSIKLASLLSKPSRREHHVDIDYLGFEIEDKFVIGYGLDFDGRYRELPYIGVLSN